LPADHLLVAQSMQGAGTVLMNNGQLDEAKPLLAEALEINRRVHGEDHPNYAESLGDWALFLYWSGQYDQAIPLFEQAVSIQQKNLPADSPPLLDNYLNLACLSAVTGKPDTALDYLDRAAVHGHQYPYIMEDPDLNSLHENPRFKELARKLGG